MKGHGENNNVHETEEGPSKEKKPRVEAHETSDVSSPISSLVVENDNDFTIESAGVATQQLLEMGCSCEQIAHAMRVCGNNTSADKMLDFIATTFCRSRNEDCTSIVPAHENDKWRHLKDMGFSEEHIDAAIKSCGKESDTIDLVEFIQAHFCINDPFLSMKNEVCLLLPEGCTSSVPAHEKDKWRCIKDMGFSEEHIDAAIKACGNESDTIDLVEFIQAHFCVNDPVKNEVCLPLPESRDLTLENDLGRRLKDMGFTEEHIEAAIKACGKEGSFEDAIEYIQALCCVQDSTFEMEKECCQVDSSEDEDSSGLTPFQKLRNTGFSSSAVEKVDSSEDEDSSGLTPFQKLRNIGFSSSAIENAMETCESLDFEDLLNFLLEADSLYGEDLQLEDGVETLAFARAPMLRDGGSKGTDEAGPSKALATSVKWTEDKIKLWYSYIGLKKDHFSDSYDSSGERSWTRNPALKVKRGRKKEEVLRFQEVTKTFRPEKMRGFAMPGYFIGRPKAVPNMMVGPPFFYFENVASTPKYEWDTIKRHLHDVEIEFTDSKFFSASRRPRGYVHNLPIDGRKLIVLEPPMTIAEALPETQKYWPWWDTREKLNCINTRRASDSLCEMIRALCIEYDGVEMPSQRQQEILQASKKWNLVWVGPGYVAPLEPHEIELLLGFDKDHTRGCSSMTDRYVALGNSFQINTVAYHLSPLKDLYPNGMTVLSLFSGIGGAEVALHKLGIHLKAVIAVEKHAKTKNVLVSWWKKTGQRGRLNTNYDDVQDLSYDVLLRIIEDVGKIDLIIGGSPCNNLSGCNRVTRTGLEGKESSLFFEFPRILNIVKQIMIERQYK